MPLNFKLYTDMNPTPPQNGIIGKVDTEVETIQKEEDNRVEIGEWLAFEMQKEQASIDLLG